MNQTLRHVAETLPGPIARPVRPGRRQRP
jgi:hypothetical protein